MAVVLLGFELVMGDKISSYTSAHGNCKIVMVPDMLYVNLFIRI